MKFISVILLILHSITESRSELKVVGSAVPLFVVAGEDLILPCYIKPSVSAVDMRVEWFRLDLENSLVHLYKDRGDRNMKQIQSYRGRTALFEQELQKGNASLKLSKVGVADEGFYKCLIESKSWYDDITVNVKVEAMGTPPVIIMEDYNAGGLNLLCECKDWYPEPEVLWLDSNGVRLNSDVPEPRRSTEGFSVKRRVTIKNSDIKFHCRVIQRHHMLETQIIVSSDVLNSQKTAVIWISVLIVLSCTAGAVLIFLVSRMTGQYSFSKNQRKRIQQVMKENRHHAVDVTLDRSTAHPCLILSDDCKKVRLGDTWQNVPNKDERFINHYFALGVEGFFSGKFYFEVQVTPKTCWYLGVVKQSVSRKESFILCPGNESWTLCCWWGTHFVALDTPRVTLSLTERLQKVGVFVNYEEGLVSFNNVVKKTHIYSFTGQSFKGKIYPFFSPFYKDNAKKGSSATLTITPIAYSS